MRYELKARTLSEMLDGTFKLYSDNLVPFLTVSAIAAIPVVACQILLGDVSKKVAAGASIATSLSTIGSLLLFLVVFSLTTMIQYSALSFAAADAYQDRPFTVGDAFGRTFGMLGSLLWAGVLLGAAVVFGYMFCIIPGVYLTLIWAVWLQAMVVEGKRGVETMRRSRALTKGSLGRIGGILLIFFVVQLALMYGISAAIPAALQSIPLLGKVLLQVPNVFIAPLYPALLTLIYFDGRIRHEGYDLEVKANEGLTGEPVSAALP
jgi:hypothetical protein